MAPLLDGIASAATGGGGGMPFGIAEGLALGTALLGGAFGGGDGGGDYTTSIEQPTLRPLPLQNEIMGAARGVYNQYSPWLYNPWRPIDYFQNVGVPGNYAPQFSQTGLPQYPVGGQGYMNDFTDNPLLIAALAQAMGQGGMGGQPGMGGAGQQGGAGMGQQGGGGGQQSLQGQPPTQQQAQQQQPQQQVPQPQPTGGGGYAPQGQAPQQAQYNPSQLGFSPFVGAPAGMTGNPNPYYAGGVAPQSVLQQQAGQQGQGQAPMPAGPPGGSIQGGQQYTPPGGQMQGGGQQPSYLGSGTNAYPGGMQGGGGGVGYQNQAPPPGGVPAGADVGTHTSPYGGQARQQQTIGPGAQHPYFNDPYGVWGPVDAPSQEISNAFLPQIFSEPYTRSTQDAMNISNYAQQAIPQAAAFQQALYSPGMTPMEQAYLGASAKLGERNLSNTHNRIEGMFENSASHGSLAPALFDATNQFNQQLNQMAGQMGTQRQTTAAQSMPFSFGFPLQAGQAAQQGSEGLHNMAQNAQLAGMPFVQSAFGSQPYAAPIAVSRPS